MCVTAVLCVAGEYAGDSVAVKLLPIGSVFAEDSRKEACLALCLHHPNIVSTIVQCSSICSSDLTRPASLSCNSGLKLGVGAILIAAVCFVQDVLSPVAGCHLLLHPAAL